MCLAYDRACQLTEFRIHCPATAPPALPWTRSQCSTAANRPSKPRRTWYREDHFRSGHRVLASLRNLAINALRLAGRTGTIEAIDGQTAT